MRNTFTRRQFIVSLAAGSGLLATGRVHGAATPATGRVIILGFDGVAPAVIEPMLEAGELPHLAKLRETGAYARLRTTIPPLSPPAWASFATCKNPGGHGIYDFVKRIPEGYRADFATGSTTHADIAVDGSVARRPASVNYRKGDTFWTIADRQGKRCKILEVPFDYPPSPLEHGIQLCGLGVPDVRGTTSTFYSISETYSKPERVPGGFKIPLKLSGTSGTVEIAGVPYSKAVAGGRSSRSEVTLPITFEVDRSGRGATVVAQGRTLGLKEGEWSDWFEWQMEVSESFSVRAISRFFPLEIGERVRIYMSCLQFHPKQPYTPISKPDGYAGEIAERMGLYKTIGWIDDTHALRQDALTEEGFLEDVERTMAWLDTLTLDELDRGDFDMLISAWTSTDRVSHTFWHHRDPKHPMYTPEGAAKYGKAIEETYRAMDRIVGQVVERLGPDDLLMIMSDHGFESFRVGFNLNTWLVENGYAALAPGKERAEFLECFDWSKTKAYSIGVSSMYLNLKGRESRGIVEAAEAKELLAELREKLLQVVDPKTGDKVFTALYTRDVYSGVAVADAPDISLGYAEGYQSSKDCAKGAVSETMFEPNMDKWSGEHASSDVERVPGILFSNRPIPNDAPDIRDLGVTALDYLGAKTPSDFEGKGLF